MKAGGQVRSGGQEWAGGVVEKADFRPVLPNGIKNS
jgi:hypothetical protein